MSDRLRVSVRVAGEIKSSWTYVQLIEDVSSAGLGRARIVEAGFLDYREVPTAIDVPPPEMERSDHRLHCELAADGLRAALKDGLGFDPRMLSGRLFVVLQAAGQGPGRPPCDGDAAGALRGLGYRVELLR